MLTNLQWFLLIIVVIIIITVYIILQNKRRQSNIQGSKKLKLAFVCLTRGYTDTASYNALIDRNKALSSLTQRLHVAHGYDVDNLIFHEGNLPLDHQEYIQKATPNWKIIFKDVHAGGTGKAFNAANAERVVDTQFIYSTKLSDFFPVGYKHMCHFWFIDFLHYVKDYSYLVRVDEDCIVTHFPVRIFQEVRRKNYVFVTPTYDAPDVPGVTVGLQTTVSNFMSENSLVEKVTLKDYKKTPYTNVCIIDVQYFLNSNLFLQFTNYIDNANGIYINRWGDLPLWSYFLANMVPKTQYAISKEIKYYHGSHRRSVNESRSIGHFKRKIVNYINKRYSFLKVYH